MTEVELVLAVLTHRAGFDISIFGGMLVARSTEDGRFCVGSDFVFPDIVGEQVFTDPLSAAEFFVQKRHELKIGVDYEVQAPVASS